MQRDAVVYVGARIEEGADGGDAATGAGRFEGCAGLGFGGAKACVVGVLGGEVGLGAVGEEPRHEFVEVDEVGEEDGAVEARRVGCPAVFG